MSVYNIVGDQLLYTYDVSGELCSGYDISGNIIHTNTPPEIEYDEISASYGLMGRWYKKEIDGTEYDFTNNAGSEIYVKAEGATQISVVLECLGGYGESFDTKHIAYSIDNSNFVRQARTNPVISMPDTSAHTVRIVVDSFKETASGVSKWDGTYGMYISSITSDGTLTGIYPRNDIGIFYGDSITEGVNALGTGALGQVNSAVNAYPMFCTQKLGTISYRVGYGATGYTAVGSFNTLINAIDYVQDGVSAPAVSPTYIVVFHGTNDRGNLTQAVVQTALDRLLVKYPNTDIFVVSPYQTMSTDVFIPVCETNARLHHVAEWGHDFETTDGAHLSSAGAEAFGEYLADIIADTI